MHPRLVLPAHLATRPFTPAEGRAAGLSTDDLRSPVLRVPRRGVRVTAAAPPGLELACRAAELVLPAHAVFDGVTAAALHDLPLPRRVNPASPLVVRVPPARSRPRVQCVRVVVEPVPAVLRRRGVRVVPVIDAWRTLALDPRLDVDDLVVVGDAIARRRGPGPLAALVEAHARRRGVGRLREALDLVRERVDSPQETRTRLLLVRAGVPEPETNLDVYADDGSGWLFCPDLRWKSVKVALEYDGRDHLADDRRSRDNARRDVAERHGWKVLVAVARDLTHGRTALVRRVEDALHERGLRW